MFFPDSIGKRNLHVSRRHLQENFPMPTTHVLYKADNGRSGQNSYMKEALIRLTRRMPARLPAVGARDLLIPPLICPRIRPPQP